MDQETLKSLFVYEPETGMLRNINPRGRVSYPWRGIGKDFKYLAYTYKGETIYLHQAVWLWHHGFIPPMLDHKDRDTKNCRIGNLRICTNSQNQFNGAMKRHNACGAKGVVFHPKCPRKPYQAKIQTKGKVYSLGYFATVVEAAAAYAAGADRIAGEFARHA